MLNLRTKLDLHIAEDRARLVAALQAEQETSGLADLVDDYTRYFTASEWHHVYRNGAVRGPQGSFGTSVLNLLRVVHYIKQLSEYPGCEHLVASLSNPTQVCSTVFEIETAWWCATRRVHRFLRFCPEVNRYGSTKRPEWIWSTEFGDLWCECKQARGRTSDEGKRHRRVFEHAVKLCDRLGLDPHDRVEIRVPTFILNGVEQLLEHLIKQALRKRRSGDPSPTTGDGISVVVRSRNEIFEGDTEVDVALMKAVRFGPTSSTTVGLYDSHAAHLVVLMNLAKARARWAKFLIAQASRQLPLDRPSAVFLDDVGTNAARHAAEKAIERGGSITWISLQSPSERRAVWGNGQAFDARLLE